MVHFQYISKPTCLCQIIQKSTLALPMVCYITSNKSKSIISCWLCRWKHQTVLFGLWKSMLRLSQYLSIFIASASISAEPLFDLPVQNLIQTKNDSVTTSAWKVWRPNLTFFSLSVLSKTVENKNFNYKWHNSYSKECV